LKRLGNKGISTIFGSILLIILVLTVASILFLTLYKYNHSVQGAIRVEEERMQEKIVLCRLASQNLSGTEYVVAILVNNTGSITSRIRAIYIDEEFLCDPSDNTINPDDTYINSKESLWILLPPGVEYVPTAKIAVATERGIKSIEYEWKLKLGGGPPPQYGITKFYFGPLWLDFNKFYYTEVDPKNGSYDPSTWKPGWRIEVGSGSIAWNITVKNVDDRNITINQFSCFTLVPNDSPGERKPWYIEPPQESFTQFIAVNETVNVIYIWKTPKMKQMTPQTIYNTVCRDKVFLTFFGVFHEHDGTTKPYGQTIPFEAVLVVKTEMEISAAPATIAVNSTMTSTITVVVYLDRNPEVNVNVTFTTDLGTLSSSWATTDATGTATVTLYPSTSPGIANITATWGGVSKSTTVTIAEGIVEISAWPTTISVNSTMNSTITAMVYLNGNPVANVNVTFTTDLGTLSSSWAITDANGIATVMLYPSTSPGTAIVEATWVGLGNSTTVILNVIPVALFTESAETVYTGEIISFNASDSYDPDGSITSYLWDFGDGTNATGVTANHTYVDDGVYTVTLTVTDDRGATDSANATKTVLNRPPIASFTESTETAYIGQPITFNATDSYDPDGSIVSYFWDFGDETNTTGVVVEHVYATNGTFTVNLTVSDDDGASNSTSSIKTILFNELPVASFTENATTADTGVIISFNASASYDSDGTITSYFWDFGDGTNVTGVTAEHAYEDDGNYTVTLTVADDKGATNSTSATKTVLNRPPVATFTESAETVDTGEVITFNASASYDPDGSIALYYWDFGDGTNATGLTVDHAYTDDGNYTVTLTVTDDDGATASAGAAKIILNRSPVAIFTESATTVLTNEVVTFNASASSDLDGTIVSYFWDFDDGTNGTGMIVGHTYADDGNYTVTLTVTDDDGAMATASSAITVLNRAPVAVFTESAETVFTGEAITFNASDSYDSDGFIASYFWDFGDGTNATGVIVSHTYAVDGIYTVALTVTDDDGATDTAEATKTVLP